MLFCQHRHNQLRLLFCAGKHLDYIPQGNQNELKISIRTNIKINSTGFAYICQNEYISNVISTTK